MPDFYFPSEKMSAFLSSLGQGFCIEANEKGNIVLMLKMEPSLVMEVVKGCRVDIVVRNPKRRCRGCAVFIHDKPGDPFFFEGEQFGEEDPFLPGFDRVLIDLIRKKNEITLALYNELNHPIFCTDLPIAFDASTFEHWIDKIHHEEADKNLVELSWQEACNPDNKGLGFNIRLLNRDHSAESKLIILSSEYAAPWRNTPMSDGRSFRLSDYLEHGKHGILQEMSITNQLGSFFIPGVNFFPSPKYSDGLEFTDYLLIDANAAIIIESKFIISEKRTKRHQALRKAVHQLNKAEDLILEGETEQLEPAIKQILKKTKVVMKVCLVNDRIELTDQNTQALSAEFDKAELPLFISLTAFIQLLVALSLKNKDFLSYNLFYNFIQIFNAYFASNDMILYKNNFSVEGLSVSELNKIGERHNVE